MVERDSASGGGGRVEESVVSRNSVVVPVKERIHVRCDQNSKRGLPGLVGEVSWVRMGDKVIGEEVVVVVDGDGSEVKLEREMYK